MSVKIPIKNPGILEIPKGEFINTPLKHFVELASKKGSGPVIKALTNLKIWNRGKTGGFPISMHAEKAIEAIHKSAPAIASFIIMVAKGRKSNKKRGNKGGKTHSDFFSLYSTIAPHIKEINSLSKEEKEAATRAMGGVLTGMKELTKIFKVGEFSE